MKPIKYYIPIRKRIFQHIAKCFLYILLYKSPDIEVPNLPVDMNSWGRLACYPRSNFYFLRDGPSTRYRRITKAGFRLCSTYKSYSQASLCLYTQQLISVQFEETFANLRYFLGEFRPKKTAHLTLSNVLLQGITFRILVILEWSLNNGSVESTNSTS